MYNLKKWQIYFDNHKNPCFITEKDTFTCLYCNQEFYRVYQLTDEIIGRNFYDFVPIVENHIEGALPDWDKQDIYEAEVYNIRLNKRFFMRSVLDKSDHVVVCEMIPTEDDLEKNFPFEEAMTQCMEILEQPPEKILRSFMELLCQYYGSEAAYVYRFDEDTVKIQLIAEWTIAPEIVVVEEIGAVIDAASVIHLIVNDCKSPLIVGKKEDTEENIPATLVKMLEVFALDNLTMCKVENTENKAVGIVGLSNPRTDTYFDRRLIHTISRFVAQDVMKKVVDSNLFHVKNRDVLTGLYNRSAYDIKVNDIKKEAPKKLGIISANINGLKNINNNLGNEHGDMHIKKSAQRIKEHFSYDTFRVSGDEIIVLAMDTDREEFEFRVSQLQEQLRVEKNYDFSMGSSWAEGKYDFVSLLREADNLMYINKQEYYSTGIRSFDSVSNVILRDLLEFLDNDEFMIYLQPQVYLKDGSLHGAEALIRRFDKKNKKMVFPDQFITLYEQSSVIRHVDLFVVDKVCKLLKEWGQKNKVLPISVNLSRVTLQEFGIVETIVEICDRYEVPHNLLVIEVTERVGLIENDVPSALVTDFIDHGFTISLDDFGCAYSNIVTLAQIELDEVKIDKSLVDNLTTNRKNHILVKNVLSMCEELEGMSTLAEGIEDETQSSLLHEMGCHLGQGYFYSRPMPVDEFVAQYIF